MNELKSNEDSFKNERDIIFLGILTVEKIYGIDWKDKKDFIKKDIENKAVKLNDVFKNPSYFHEKFEFLSSDDYNYIKNIYIYSAILIYNPNLNENSNVNENYVCDNSKLVNIKEIKINKNQNNEIEKKNMKTNTKIINKKEGIGVLILTCKKMEKVQMKYMLIKILKKEIKIDMIYLKRNNNQINKNEKNMNGKLTEIKNIENNNLYETNKMNNFFNITTYIYGGSNLLSNTSLIQRELRDEEWSELLKKKKQKNLPEKNINKNNFFSSITSFFRTK